MALYSIADDNALHAFMLCLDSLGACVCTVCTFVYSFRLHCFSDNYCILLAIQSNDNNSQDEICCIAKYDGKHMHYTYVVHAVVVISSF